MRYALTLQGPSSNGKQILETWALSKDAYMYIREMFIAKEPVVTTVTDRSGSVLSQHFVGGVDESDEPPTLSGDQQG